MLTLITVFIFSVFVVLVLFVVSNKINHRKNSFIRLFPPHKIAFLNSIDLKYNSYYFAGIAGENIYLANYTAPLILFKTNRQLTDTFYLRLYLDDTGNYAWKSFEVFIDSTNIYLGEGNTPAVFTGTLSNYHLKRLDIPNNHFNSFLPLSKSSFVIRTINPTMRQNVLAGETLRPPRLKYITSALRRQVDGIFCTDGIMCRDKKSSLFIYLYYYRNQYVCMDTSFNVLYMGNTIDTNTVAKITVAGINSNNTLTMSTPPLTVNKSCCIAEGNLFIHSLLKADNENGRNFGENSVIDVYSLKDRRYKWSFYLPDLYGYKAGNFRINGNTLTAIYDHYIVSFNFSLN